MDGGAWWAAVHGVTKSRTWLSDFTFTFHFYALEKEMATHSSVLAWRIPGTGEPGGLPSMGSHRVGHDWSDLAAAAAASGYFYWAAGLQFHCKNCCTPNTLLPRKHGSQAASTFWGYRVPRAHQMPSHSFSVSWFTFLLFGFFCSQSRDSWTIGALGSWLTVIVKTLPPCLQAAWLSCLLLLLLLSHVSCVQLCATP